MKITDALLLLCMVALGLSPLWVNAEWEADALIGPTFLTYPDEHASMDSGTWAFTGAVRYVGEKSFFDLHPMGQCSHTSAAFKWDSGLHLCQVGVRWSGK